MMPMHMPEAQLVMLPGPSESSSLRTSSVSELFWRMQDKQVKCSFTNNLQHYFTSLLWKIKTTSIF